jgi:hypothetical protein
LWRLRKSKVKTPAGSVPAEEQFLVLQLAAFCALGWWRERQISGLSSFSYKNTNHIMGTSPSSKSFTSLKPHLQTQQGVMFSTYKGRGNVTNIQPITDNLSFYF